MKGKLLVERGSLIKKRKHLGKPGARMKGKLLAERGSLIKKRKPLGIPGIRMRGRREMKIFLRWRNSRRVQCLQLRRSM